MLLHKIIRNDFELLSPAGDWERLEMALHYGADAVYLAGREFGMRASAGNFENEQLVRAVEKAHGMGRKVYVTCNTLPHEDELERLPGYLGFLQEAGPDGLIIADLGVMALARRFAPKLHLHVSTQLGVVNSAAALALYAMGADTVVLARETSLEEIRKIRARCPSDLRLEAFVHGAMCVSFSGRCLLSNYMTGRDANRGACAQPCRWKYSLVEQKRPGQYYDIIEDGGTHIMNSNDLCMIGHLQELAEAGVCSFKIEGRMKSAYYAAVVTNAYRHALDAVAAGDPVPEVWVRETEMVSHRPYCTGFYYEGGPGQSYEGGYVAGADIVAMVEQCDGQGNAVVTERNCFACGDELELVTPDAEPVSFILREMADADGNPITDARHAMMEVHLRLPMQAGPLSILRKRR